MHRILITVGILCLARSLQALDNGLALTPPMGWLAWERFRCNVDCINDPDNCISERLFMTMADLMVSEGYAAAGYNIISLDDCWLSHERDAEGKLQPDPDRFPSGIKGLADYVHSKGLKFGIYEDYGTKTCAGYPGVLGHLQVDAQTFADWEVDYVKLDGCNVDPHQMDEGYPEFGKYLNQTGRPIIYSCEWPLYQLKKMIPVNWTALASTCNLWRFAGDITDTWASVTKIVNYIGTLEDEIASHAAPGGWNDPDMLVIGNFGLSYEQSKAQMALWAIMASPLLMSVDLRTIDPKYKAILQNKDVIAVNQDPLGIQGTRVYNKGPISIWRRPITPTKGKDHSQALVIFSQSIDGTPINVTITPSNLGMNYTEGYYVTDLYSGASLGKISPDQQFHVIVNPSGVVMLRCSINSSHGSINNTLPNPYAQLPYHLQVASAYLLVGMFMMMYISNIMV